MAIGAVARSHIVFTRDSAAKCVYFPVLRDPILEFIVFADEVVDRRGIVHGQHVRICARRRNTVLYADMAQYPGELGREQPGRGVIHGKKRVVTPARVLHELRYGNVHYTIGLPLAHF